MHILPSITILPIAAASVTSCGPRHTDSCVASIESSGSIPSSVKTLVKAVAGDDSAAFAHLVSYPLLRPYPLRDITGEDQMRAYYATLVDDSLKAIVTGSEPSAWQEYGWRGWSLDDGRYVWLDESLYDIPYVSQAERKELSQLMADEISSLVPELRQGWTPVACMRSASGPAVMRIDVATGDDGGPQYRLAVFATPAQMRSTPRALLTGYRDVEGSASIISYHFTAPDGSTATYQADVPDGSDPTVEFTSASGADSIVTVVPAYWRDLLPSSTAN